MSTSPNIQDIRRALADALQTMRAQITNFRDKIAALRAELALLDRPIPLEEVRARIPGVVAERGRAWLDVHGTALIFSGHESYPALAAPDVPGSVRLPDGLEHDWLGALCAGDPARAEAMLSTLVSRVEYQPGPPASERAARRAELETELANIEAAEEQAIDAAAEAGLLIAHREEVTQRRANEARAQELEARAVAYRAERQAELDAQLDQPAAHRSAVSQYIASGGKLQ